MCTSPEKNERDDDDPEAEKMENKDLENLEADNAVEMMCSNDQKERIVVEVLSLMLAMGKVPAVVAT